VAAADPLEILGAHLPPRPRGRLFVAAAGKAAASMALATERHYASGIEGIAVTRYRHGLPTQRIRVVEAGHPVPDEAGENAARSILEEAKKLKEEDLLLALLSGGGSSLLALPAPGVSMAQLKGLTGELLRSGADIREMNTVRKHLSAIQGGRLPRPGARAHHLRRGGGRSDPHRLRPVHAGPDDGRRRKSDPRQVPHPL
jgi:hydroxypyruvate reductase